MSKIYVFATLDSMEWETGFIEWIQNMAVFDDLDEAKAFMKKRHDTEPLNCSVVVEMAVGQMWNVLEHYKINLDCLEKWTYNWIEDKFEHHPATK